MTKRATGRRMVSHEFVEFIPDKLQEGVLYVSTTYATAAHRCLCGCGREVVTPLSPTDWQLTFNGESISLWPSVGNWSFPCRAHYVIERNRVNWCGDMPQQLIDAGRARDRLLKAAHFGDRLASSDPKMRALQPEESGAEVPRRGLWSRLTAWWHDR
ncbi:DUF6527 family protein [Piscinibacter sp. HJYY11]|uniref:DUF6527 family protein n=1 Tax=Piscinibacter sp. HJYY11 TaxID=2801333 RepID=UPI00191D1A73|nr:DUF6527 family protein [Piscinibacter sp. HJYY11]MBL0726616.1 hypothetical protein [Piscinibacter sp. HJYY11]